jgi:hypothetical protein
MTSHRNKLLIIITNNKLALHDCEHDCEHDCGHDYAHAATALTMQAISGL